MAANLTTFMCRFSGNLGASVTWNTQGLSRPVQRLLYFCVTFRIFCANIYVYIMAQKSLETVGII